MSPSITEGAGNAGCALHPRSRVQNCAKKRTRAYRFSGCTPAFPAQWLYGLCRALPGDQALLSPSPCRCWRIAARSGGCTSTKLDASPRGVRTTRFCRTRHAFAKRLRRVWYPSDEILEKTETAPLVLHGGCSLTETALRTNPRADAVASTTSHPAFVTIATRPSSGIR